MNINPNDATEYLPVFLDCSSYVNAVYNYSFGINIVPTPTTANMNSFARDNIGTNNEVVYYVDAEHFEGDKETKLAEIQSNLQVGDLVCYRHNGSSAGGHVMLYVGNNTFLHCTGYSFNYTSDPSASVDKATTIEKNNGAIQLLSANDVFVNTGSDRYLFADENTSFSVLRPLAREGLELTEQATLRSFIPYIVIEKTATTPHMSTVSRGEDITYSITLTNKGAIACNNLVIRDVISSLCTYKNDSIDSGGVVAGNNVTWTIASLASNASITVSYTVTVNNDATIGSVIESYQGNVNGVLTNKIYHTIGGFSNNQYNLIETKANELIGTDYSSDSSDGFKMAIDLYSDSGLFGRSFTGSNSTTATNIVNKLIWDNRDYNTIDKTCSYYPLVNPNFYGGLLIKEGMVSDNNRLRIYKSDYFETGDIIVLYNSYDSKKYTYIYVDNSTIIGLDSNDIVAKLYTTEDDVSLFLSQLIAYNRFVVLRPALTYNPS